MSSVDTPTCITLIACDRVLQDARTNNKSLIGIFNAIQVSQLPATHPRVHLFMQLTNVRGSETVRIILRSPGGKTLLDINGNIQNGIPTEVYDFDIEVLGVTFEEIGTHFLDVVHRDRILTGRRFEVQRQ